MPQPEASRALGTRGLAVTMPDSRLAFLDPELLSELRRASSDQCRTAAFAAARLVLESTEFDHRLIQLAMRATDHETRLSIRRQLEALVAALDDRYFDLQAAADQGRIPRADVEAAFAVARAANTVLCALHPDPVFAAAEAAYEAQAAVDSPAAVRREMLQALNASQDPRDRQSGEGAEQKRPP